MIQSKERLADRIFKRPIDMLPTKYFRCKDTQRLKVKGQKKIFPENGNQKRKLELQELY